MPADLFDTNVLIYLAAALQAQRDTLWPEDMQDGVALDGAHRFGNPFGGL